jgi:hypothetical protein
MNTVQGPAEACPVCGADPQAESRAPGWQAACSRCGHLIWFTWDDNGADQVIRPTGNMIPVGSLEKLDGFLKVKQGTRLVFDLCTVKYISSADLFKLILFKRKIVAAQGHLVLRHVHADILEVLQITRFDTMLEIET